MATCITPMNSSEAMKTANFLAQRGTNCTPSTRYLDEMVNYQSIIGHSASKLCVNKLAIVELDKFICSLCNIIDQSMNVSGNLDLSLGNITDDAAGLVKGLMHSLEDLHSSAATSATYTLASGTVTTGVDLYTPFTTEMTAGNPSITSSDTATIHELKNVSAAAIDTAIANHISLVQSSLALAKAEIKQLEAAASDLSCTIDSNKQKSALITQTM